MFESNLLDDLKSVMKTNDIVRYRVYEVRLKAYFLVPTIQNAVELTLEGKMAFVPCIECVVCVRLYIWCWRHGGELPA